MKSDRFYLNGQLIDSADCLLPISDRSFLFGEGLFETILVKDGRAHFVDDHIDRLAESCQFFEYHFEPDKLKEGVAGVVTENNLKEGRVRITVSATDQSSPSQPMARKTSILINFVRGAPYSTSQYREGLKALIARTTIRNEQSPLSSHKSTSYGDSLMASREAKRGDVDVAILLNSKGSISEAHIANIFLATEREIVTPPLVDGPLPGVIRAKVISLCQRHNIPIKEISLEPKDLTRYRFAFLTNSLMGIMPLSSMLLANTETVRFNLFNSTDIVGRLQQLLSKASLISDSEYVSTKSTARAARGI